MNMNDKLDNVLGTKVEVIKENKEPTEGIWYYLYLKPKWVRLIITNQEYGSYGHPQFWEKYIVPKLIQHYKLDDSQIDKLNELPYSMPRGRVTFTGKDTGIHAIVGGEEEQPNTWHLDHGNDFPLDKESEERRLISGFNLTGPANSNKVKFRRVNHETMLPAQQARLTAIIGEVPY